LAPFHEYHERHIVSSRTYLTPEEQTLLAIQKMKDLPQATFCLKVPDHSAIFVRAPWVDEPLITKKTLGAGLQRVHSLPYYTHVEQHQPPAIDVEARVLPTQRPALEPKALPQQSPALDDDDEPQTFRHRRTADSPAPDDDVAFWHAIKTKYGGRQEKS
jgi:hypothetical protein